MFMAEVRACRRFLISKNFCERFPVPTFKDAVVPANGQAITISNGKLNVPDHPVLPFIEGDGTGPDIWKASVRVFDAAVDKAFKGKKKIAWMEVFAGEKSFNKYQSWLHEDTVPAFQHFSWASRAH